MGPGEWEKQLALKSMRCEMKPHRQALRIHWEGKERALPLMCL